MNKNKIFIIAEAGVNHNGSLKNALKLVRIAKKCGADAIKFQLFNMFEQISKNAPTAPYQKKELAKKICLKWQDPIILIGMNTLKLKIIV